MEMNAVMAITAQDQKAKTELLLFSFVLSSLQTSVTNAVLSHSPSKPNGSSLTIHYQVIKLLSGVEIKDAIFL